MAGESGEPVGISGHRQPDGGR